MVSNGALEQQFISRVLKTDMKSILSEQSSAAASLLKMRTGRLATNLSNESCSVIGSETFTIIQHSYPIYLRFLDIKQSRKKSNTSISLYNRVIWNTIYKHTYNTLRTEFKKEVEKNIYNQLNQK